MHSCRTNNYDKPEEEAKSKVDFTNSRRILTENMSRRQAHLTNPDLIQKIYLTEKRKQGSTKGQNGFHLRHSKRISKTCNCVKPERNVGAFKQEKTQQRRQARSELSYVL